MDVGPLQCGSDAVLATGDMTQVVLRTFSFSVTHGGTSLVDESPSEEVTLEICFF